MDHEGATYKTLRDEIAIEVFKVLLKVDKAGFPTGITMEHVCMAAYKWADFMLKAREAE